MLNPNLKIEYCNIPVSVPVEWKDALQRQANEMGVSRNTAFQMSVRLGAPLLEAHIRLMRKTLRANARKIEQGKCDVSKILGTPASALCRVRANHDKRKS